MPSEPIEMPSDTVMVLKITALAPAASAPAAAAFGQLVDVHVARGHLAPRRADADLRLGEVGAREADGVQHRPAGGARRAVDDGGREAAGRWARTARRRLMRRGLYHPVVAGDRRHRPGGDPPRCLARRGVPVPHPLGGAEGVPHRQDRRERRRRPSRTARCASATRSRIERPLGRTQIVVVRGLADRHIAKADARALYDDRRRRRRPRRWRCDASSGCSAPPWRPGSGPTSASAGCCAA